MKKRFSDEQIINISAKPKLGYRIYQLNGLSVKRRRRRKGLATERLPLLRPAAPNLTWSMDFVMDALSTGRRIKCLTCVDDFTKECLTVTVAFGISGVQVTRILDSIALFRGYPATIRGLTLSGTKTHVKGFWS